MVIMFVYMAKFYSLKSEYNYIKKEFEHDKKLLNNITEQCYKYQCEISSLNQKVFYYKEDFYRDPYTYKDPIRRSSKYNPASVTSTKVIDETTYKLIMLAVDDSNDNESRNAAINACKRIAKKIK